MAAGDHCDEAEEAITDREAQGINPRLCAVYQRPYYVYKSYLRLLQLFDSDSGDRKQSLRRLDVALSELNAAANIKILRAHYYGILGGRALALDRLDKALGYLDRAEAIARTVDAPWIYLEASYIRALVFLRRGFNRAAKREGMRAVKLANQCGWFDRARRIRAELHLGGGGTHVAEASGSFTGSGDHSAGLRLKRQLNALLQISLASK